MDKKMALVVAVAIVCVAVAIVVGAKAFSSDKPDEKPVGTPTSPEDAKDFGGPGAGNPNRTTGGMNR